MNAGRTRLFLLCVLSVSMVCCLTPGVIFGYDVENIQIQVSPNVLNIGSKGEIITVHTDLPYASVVGASVFLNGVPISWWKADDRGFFVAKFDIDKVKYEAGLVVGNNTVMLTGVTTSGSQFTGSQDLKVVDNVPKVK